MLAGLLKKSVKNKKKVNRQAKAKAKDNKQKKPKHTSLKRTSKQSRKGGKTKCLSGMKAHNTPDGIICVGRCPHSGGPIYYNPATDKFICKWHGSQFTRKGKVLNPPAMSNLNISKPLHL